MLNELEIVEVRVFQEEIHGYAQSTKPELMKIIRERQKLDPEIETGISEIVKGHVKAIISKRKKETIEQVEEYLNKETKVAAHG